MSSKIIERHQLSTGEWIEAPQPPADIHNCPAAELGEYLWQRQVFENRLSADINRGQQAQKDPAYEMPISELRAKCEEEKRQADAAALEARRTQAAVTFASLHPDYKLCPENAEVMHREITARGLSSTAEISQLFQELKQQGRLQLNQVPLTPARIYSVAELEAMPKEEMIAALNEMARNAVY